MVSFLEGNCIRRSGGPVKLLKTDWFNKPLTVASEYDTFLEYVWQGSYENVEKMLLSNKQLATLSETFESAPLSIAVNCGYDDISRLLISKGDADVHIIGEKGDNLLHIAPKWSTIEMLVHFGVNINHQNNWGNSPLQQACYNSQYSEISAKVEGLMNMGADCTSRDKVGRSCLHDIVLHSDIDLTHLINRLIANGCKINARDHFGHSPLNIASILSNYFATRALLSYVDCDVNISTKQGSTPLIGACSFNWFENHKNPVNVIKIIQVLLEHGASVNITDNLGSNPLHSLLNCYYFFVADLQVTTSSEIDSVDDQPSFRPDNDNYSNATKRTTDLTSDNLNIVSVDDTLLNGNQTINRSEMNADLLRTYSTRSNSSSSTTDFKSYEMEFNAGITKTYREARSLPTLISIIDLLLQYGCDINHTDHSGFTALHWATGKINSRGLTSFLLERGARADIADRWGTLPIHYAAMAGDQEMINKLLTNGALLMSLDNSQSNIFHYAAWNEIHPDELFDELSNDLEQLKLKENSSNMTPLDVYTFFKREKKLCNMVGKIVHPDISATKEQNEFIFPRNVYEMTKSEHEQNSEESSNSDTEIYVESDLDSEILDSDEDITINNPSDLKPEMFPFAFHPDKEQKLFRLLKSPQVGIIPDIKDVKQVRSDLQCLMDRLANLIGLLDSRFKCEPILTGSSNEGTKCTYPNEFDFLFVMTRIATDEICIGVEGTTNGYVKFCKKSNVPDDMEIFFNNYGFLEMQRFKVLFQNVCLICLHNKDIWNDLRLYQIGYQSKDNPSHNIYLEFKGECMKVLTVSVDIVPAIRINCIPNTVRCSTLPCLTEDIYRENILAVSKTGPNESGLLSSVTDFRLSFSILEARILEWAPREALYAYVLAKILTSEDVCRLNFKNFDFNEICNSYLLKTALLHVLEKEQGNVVPTETEINQSAVIDWTRKLFEQLLESASSSLLSSFFVPGFSVFFRTSHNAQLEELLPVISNVNEEDACKLLDGINCLSFMKATDYFDRRQALLCVITACLYILKKGDNI